MAQFVVVDNENEVAVGPFSSEDEAKTFFIERAHYEEWDDVCDLIAKTGSPFVSSFRQDGLVLVDFARPEEPANTGHCEAENAEHWQDGSECGMCGGAWVFRE